MFESDNSRRNPTFPQPQHGLRYLLLNCFSLWHLHNWFYRPNHSCYVYAASVGKIMKGKVSGNTTAVKIKLQPACRHLFTNLKWYADMTSHKQNDSGKVKVDWSIIVYVGKCHKVCIWWLKPIYYRAVWEDTPRWTKNLYQFSMVWTNPEPDEVTITVSICLRSDIFGRKATTIFWKL